MNRLKDLYFKFGEKINGYYYLPQEHRYKLMKRVFDKAREFNVTFAVCREGFVELNSGKTRDGSHLIQ